MLVLEGAAWRHLVQAVGVAKVERLVVDVDGAQAAAEAGEVAQVPVGEGGHAHLGRHAPHEEGRGEAQEVLVAGVDDGAGTPPVHPQREVLPLHQQLGGVLAPVRQLLEAVHGRHRVVAHVEAHLQQSHSFVCHSRAFHTAAKLKFSGADYPGDIEPFHNILFKMRFLKLYPSLFRFSLVAEQNFNQH